jgi:hypothetical protein
LLKGWHCVGGSWCLGQFIVESDSEVVVKFLASLVSNQVGQFIVESNSDIMSYNPYPSHRQAL